MLLLSLSSLVPGGDSQNTVTTVIYGIVGVVVVAALIFGVALPAMNPSQMPTTGGNETSTQEKQLDVSSNQGSGSGSDGRVVAGSSNKSGTAGQSVRGTSSNLKKSMAKQVVNNLARNYTRIQVKSVRFHDDTLHITYIHTEEGQGELKSTVAIIIGMYKGMTELDRGVEAEQLSATALNPSGDPIYKFRVDRKFVANFPNGGVTKEELWNHVQQSLKPVNSTAHSSRMEI